MIKFAYAYSVVAILIGTLFGSFAPTFAFAASIYCPAISQTLQYGNNDSTTVPIGQVSELQKFLADYNDVDRSELVTGNFRTITRQYVINFQKDQNFASADQSGIVGPKTRAAIAGACGNVGSAPASQLNTVSGSPSQVEFGGLVTISWHFASSDLADKIGIVPVGGGASQMQDFINPRSANGSGTLRPQSAGTYEVIYVRYDGTILARSTNTITVSIPSTSGVGACTFNSLSRPEGSVVTSGSFIAFCDNSIWISTRHPGYAGFVLPACVMGNAIAPFSCTPPSESYLPYTSYTLSARHGTAPFTVTASFQSHQGAYPCNSSINWGDGTIDQISWCGGSIDTTKATHTYPNAGSYKIDGLRYNTIRVDGAVSGGNIGGTVGTGSNLSTSTTSCNFNGQTISHGGSVAAYAAPTVPLGAMCLAPQVRVCNNGTLSGSYQYASCATSIPTVDCNSDSSSTLCTASCFFNGQTIPNNSGVKAYNSPTVPFGASCLAPEVRICHNGSLTGSYQYASCSPSSPPISCQSSTASSPACTTSCTFNGQTVADGASISAYPADAVPFGAMCATQTRTCHNGVLDGTFPSATCSHSSSSTSADF